jgi:DNA polymerase V
MTQSGCGALEPYALRVLGDSMEPEFGEGCVIIIDPGYEYAGDVFFRQLIVDGDRRFLKPLNDKYGRFELIPPYTIRGGVIQQRGKRRSQHRHYE